MKMRNGVLLVLAPVLLVGTPCRSQQPSQPSTGARSTTAIRTFSISGNVRYETEQVAENVQVALVLLAGQVVASTFTRSNGEFEFAGLSPGTYYLVLQEKGYEPFREAVEILRSDRRAIYLYLNRPDRFSPRVAGHKIAARELSLPPKAVEAFRKGEQKLYDRQDAKGSLSHFRRALEIAPGYYEAHYQMGVSYLKLGQMADAEAAFRKSIEESNDSYAGPYFGLAAMLCGNNKFAECEAAARRGLGLDPNDWRGHYNLASSLVGLDRLDEAERHLREVNRLQPTFAEAYLLAANIYIRRKDYPSVLTMLEEYLKLEPDGPMSASVRQTQDAVRQRMAAKEQAKPSP